MRFHLHSRRAQSLIEILIAVGIGSILVLGAVATLEPALKIGSDANRIQVAGALGKELLDNVVVMSEGNWHSIDGLATTSLNTYYLAATSSPFTVLSGIQAVAVATATYTRYFYLDDVYRNAASQIDESGATLDPSVKKVTVVYAWPGASSTRLFGSALGLGSLSAYITRHNDGVFFQTDWSGGPNPAELVTATSTNARFASSSGIDYATTTGAIVISGF